MHFQFGVGPSTPPPPAPAGSNTAITDLLQQILDVQREHLALARAAAAANDVRWRTLLNRWRDEFPELAGSCKQALPVLEQAFGAVIAAMVEELREKGTDALDNDFALQDFLDRHGMRLGQVGHLLNLLAPLAEAATQSESSEQNPH